MDFNIAHLVHFICYAKPKWDDSTEIENRIDNQINVKFKYDPLTMVEETEMSWFLGEFMLKYWVL